LAETGVGGLFVKYVFLTAAQKTRFFTATPRIYCVFIRVIRPYPWFKNLTTDFTDSKPFDMDGQKWDSSMQAFGGTFA
jgi:hypothetical protein